MTRPSPHRTLLSWAACLLLAACGGDRMAPEDAQTYLITAGACGNVVFVEALGSDSASAMAALEERKARQYGEGAVTLETYELEVVGEHGGVPEPTFYAVRVLDAGTGILLHSVSEVVTSEGDLFWLLWCPD